MACLPAEFLRFTVKERRFLFGVLRSWLKPVFCDNFFSQVLSLALQRSSCLSESIKRQPVFYFWVSIFFLDFLPGFWIFFQDFGFLPGFWKKPCKAETLESGRGRGQSLINLTKLREFLELQILTSLLERGFWKNRATKPSKTWKLKFRRFFLLKKSIQV